MNTSTMSTVAHGVIDSYGHVALNCIAAVNGGSLRLLDKAGSSWQANVERRGARLSDALRGDLASAGNEVLGYFATGFKKVGDSAVSIINGAAQRASESLQSVSTRAQRLEGALGTRVLPSLVPIAMPAVRASFDVAQMLVTESGKMAGRVAGASSDVVVSPKLARKVPAKRARRTS
jgi:hypothetical protein